MCVCVCTNKTPQFKYDSDGMRPIRPSVCVYLIFPHEDHSHDTEENITTSSSSKRKTTRRTKIKTRENK